jgi:hypothetical protein
MRQKESVLFLCGTRVKVVPSINLRFQAQAKEVGDEEYVSSL